MLSYNQELLEKKTKLESYAGQLIDLKSDFLKEIVIKKGDDADLLFEIIQDTIERIELDLAKEGANIV